MAENIVSFFKNLICNIRDAVLSISGQHGSLIARGTGFFIKGHYIICPADLILLPPFDDTSFIRANRILATVSNVNGLGISYSYEVDLIGVDGAANIAVLMINMDRSWNRLNPKINSSHPFLHWGKSRNMCPGDTIILIGDIINRSSSRYIGVENGVVIGNLADNRYVSYDGSIPGELLLLSNVLSSNQQRGLPVINQYGKVIGMSLYSAVPNVALSEFFMRRPVRALIRTHLESVVPDHYQGFVEIISDDLGSYYRFNKGWIGLYGQIITQDFYADIPNQPKDIVGYLITNLAPKSSATGLIEIHDIVTHIKICPLGDRKEQISTGLGMWRIAPGSSVELTYRKASEHYTASHRVSVIAEKYTPFYDYPWYTCSSSSILM